MGILVGFAVGYVLGARAGREKLDELQEAWRTISGSPEFQALTAQALTLLSAATPVMARMVLEQGPGLARGLAGLGLGDFTGDRVRQIVTEMMKGDRAS